MMNQSEWEEQLSIFADTAFLGILFVAVAVDDVPVVGSWCRH